MRSVAGGIVPLIHRMSSLPHAPVGGSLLHPPPRTPALVTRARGGRVGGGGGGVGSDGGSVGVWAGGCVESRGVEVCWGEGTETVGRGGVWGDEVRGLKPWVEVAVEE